MTLIYESNDAAGVENCRPIISSGSEERDKAACRTLIERGIPKDVAPARSIGDQARWVTTFDYPKELFAARASGFTEVLLEIGEKGRVTGCRVIGTSGHDRLDMAACNALSARARFSPATFRGAPVPAIDFRRVRWTAPFRPPPS
ncbi:energy transducer TonB [Sphingomonas sp. DBB INV C78]|uniref:energy transducer TonB n=1 Tax=Sphingomonas sp. DBB INV C78 TaxID=3349434 RepID=UPI0036D254F7